MSNTSITKLLLVEDSAGDARLLREMLNEEDTLNTELTHVQYMSDAERQTLTKGLDQVDAAAQSAHRASFVTLSTDRQDDVLRGIARAGEGQDQGFFRLIRSATVLGYFTSEPIGKNVLHYDPVPGRYDSCIPIDEVGRRNWTT